MNRPNDNERLLADVLAGEDAAGLREALFSETRRLARRRRRLRQARRASPLAALLVGVALALWHSSPRLLVKPEAVQRSYAVIRSQPLPTAALVSTQPATPDLVVASFTDFQIVRTIPGDTAVQEIGDDELLALVEPKPAALVWRGPHTAELVVLGSANPEDVPPN